MKSMEIKNIFRKKEKNTRVIPGFGLTMGITVTMLSLLILIPLISVFIYSFKMKPSEFWQLITAKQVANALATSFLCSVLAAVINSIFGVILAWVLVRYEFPGKRLVDGLIELPFALPTAVAGITLSKMYSSTGMLGKPLSMLGIDVSYTKTGIVVALEFVGIPFVVRAIQPVLEKLDGQYEEAAYILGAGRAKTFFRVILPELTPALLTGSVIYISGNSAKNHTQVISYVIMQKLNYIDYESATAIALVMLVFSFLILLFVNIIQVRQVKKTL